MAQYEPTWSYGESKLFNSSGATVDSGDDIWNYGQDELFHEYITPVGVIGSPWYYYLQEIGD